MGKSIQVTVNEQEKKLIDLIRKTKYGELKILVKDSLPIRVEEMKKSIKLWFIVADRTTGGTT